MMTSLGGSVTDLVNNKKNAQKGTRGVKIDMTGAALKLDLYLTVRYGTPIPEVAENAQKAVSSAVEAMTGCSVEAVNIHVGGVTTARCPLTFKREKRTKEYYGTEHRAGNRHPSFLMS